MIYEADPRHVDLLMSSLNLVESNSVSSPGQKPSDRDEMAIKLNEDDNISLSHFCPDEAISAIMRSPSKIAMKAVEPSDHQYGDEPNTKIAAVLKGHKTSSTISPTMSSSSWADMSDGETQFGSTSHVANTIPSPLGHNSYIDDLGPSDRRSTHVDNKSLDYNFNNCSLGVNTKLGYLHAVNYASNHTDSVDKHASLENDGATSQNHRSLSLTK